MEANSEPTTYETPDSPKLDYTESPPPPEYQSEYISLDPVNPKLARSTFDKSQVDSTSADFRTTKTRGWQISARPETQAERLTRLRREIEEVRTDLAESEHEPLINSLEAVWETQSQAIVKDAPGRVAAKISLESIERLSLLESRISSIENRFDSSSDNNLAAQINLLRVKVNTITEKEVTEERIQHLKQLNEESAVIAHSTVMNRVDELYEAASSIRNFGNRTPMVLERLRCLQGLHEDAAESKMKLDAVQSVLLDRRTEVANWRQALQSMEEQMANGVVALHQNAEILRSIIEPLLQKLD